MYTDQGGWYACDTRPPPEQLRPGSRGHGDEDVVMSAAWNTAYLKVGYIPCQGLYVLVG